MSSPSSIADATPPGAVELSTLDLEQMRKAAGWSRFIAILGFIGFGLGTIGVVTLFALRGGRSEGTLLIFAFTAIAAPSLVAAAFVWRYANRMRSFIDRGEPDAAEGFRSLRRFFTAWTLLSAVALLFSVLSTLQQLKR